MNNPEIYIVFEGQTEQKFIREVLAPELSTKGIFLHAALIGRPGHKGGKIRFDRAKNDIKRFLELRKETYVSTMFDYFRIDTEWPRLVDVYQKLHTGKQLDADEKAKIIEKATSIKICETFNTVNAGKRFIPYIEMHEFEDLLFSDAEILAKRIGKNSSEINKIINTYRNPEEINDDPEKAPSNQIKGLIKNYRKVAMGKAISSAIGIKTIRLKCPHFHSWLEKLEKLAE